MNTPPKHHVALGRLASIKRRRGVLYAALPLLLLVVTGTSPQASISRTVIDLGVVRRGELRQESVVVTNSGVRALRIDQRARTCGVRVHTDTPTAEVARGGAVSLRLDIDTSLFPEGTVVRELSIPTNDPVKRSLVLTFRAEVRSDVALEPAVLRLARNRPTAVSMLRIMRGSDVETVSVRATNSLVTADLRRDESTRDDVFIVTARASTGQTLPWNLGMIVITTKSQAVPELRIPVRGIPPWASESGTRD